MQLSLVKYWTLGMIELCRRILDRLLSHERMPAPDQIVVREHGDFILEASETSTETSFSSPLSVTRE